MIVLRDGPRTPRGLIFLSGVAAESPGHPMQRIWDKWGLPALAVIIGSVILWGLFFAPGRPADAPTKPGAATGK
jgi:hypothetical protein